MMTTGLYEWLLKVVSVSGVIGGEEGEQDALANHAQEQKKEKDDKKPPLGVLFMPAFIQSYRSQLLTHFLLTIQSSSHCP